MTRSALCFGFLVMLTALAATPTHAGWLDQLLGGGKSNVVASATALSADEMTRGLKEALAQGAEKAIKNLTSKAGIMASILQKERLDVDQYVTDKAFDGLFKMIAAEEMEIRKNPMARGTDLLKKVFGSVSTSPAR